MEKVTKRHCHTGKHSVSGVGASSKSLEDFPADVFFNILLSLPVKSLMCCRSVCKTWRNIIDSPSFINTHFTSRRAGNSEEHQLMLVSHAFQRGGKLRLFTLMDAGINKVLRSSEFPIVEIANSSDYLAETVCNGLLCFRNYFGDIGRVFLVDPLRKEVLKLPQATVTAHPGFYGVGFDCTTKTYKVVRFFSRRQQQHDDHLAAEVHTLGTRSWREIPNVPPYNESGKGVVSAYGDVHWLGRKQFPDGSDDEFMIVSLVTRKEEFKLIPHPKLPANLFDFRGDLAMVDDSSGTHFDVWVLKDYEKNEWAIEYRINAELLFGPENQRIRCRKMIIGVGAWEDGILFQRRRNDLVYYDPKTDNLKFMCIPPSNDVPSCDKKTFGHTKIFGYTRSLVSLKNSGNIIAGLRNCFDLSTAG